MIPKAAIQRTVPATRANNHGFHFNTRKAYNLLLFSQQRSGRLGRIPPNAAFSFDAGDGLEADDFHVIGAEGREVAGGILFIGKT